MASVEPSTNHLVISPIWITRVLESDKGKRAAPSPFAMVETLTKLRDFAVLNLIGLRNLAAVHSLLAIGHCLFGRVKIRD